MEHTVWGGVRRYSRQPTLWERYQWWIVGVLAIGLLQAGLILLLGVNLVRRRRVERALRESEERLDVAAHSSGAGLWGLDLDTRRIWATSRLRELFQLSPVDDLEVEAVLAVVHPADHVRGEIDQHDRHRRLAEAESSLLPQRRKLHKTNF